MLTRSPRLSSRQPMEAAARPLPRLDTTPPVTKMYFADKFATSWNDLWICAVCARLSIAGSWRRGNGGLLDGLVRAPPPLYLSPKGLEGETLSPDPVVQVQS